MKLARLHFTLHPKRDLPIMAVGALLALAVVEVISLANNHRTTLPYQPGGITIPWVSSTVKRWHTPIDEMSKRYNIDPDLVAIIMTLESGGDATASSSAGAKGLMQVTAPTARDIASKYLKTPVTKYDLANPTTNIEFGVAYLAQLRSTFGDANDPDWTTVELVADAYNGGPGAANDVLLGNGLQDTQTVVYGRDAFNMWRERHAHDSPTFDRWKERGGSILIENAQKNKQPNAS